VISARAVPIVWKAECIRNVLLTFLLIHSEGTSTLEGNTLRNETNSRHEKIGVRRLTHSRALVTRG